MAIADRLVARKHTDWLSLVEISGSFLSIPVLLERFPHGLDALADEREVRRRVGLAYEEWLDNQLGRGERADPAIHRQWILHVLQEVLSYHPEALLEDQQIPNTLRYVVREHGETLRPDWVLKSPYEQQPRLLVCFYPIDQKLEKVVPEKRWKASPATRIGELLRNTGVHLGLVTNGRQWMLVDAPAGETTGYYTWDASLWQEEPVTLQSFRTLLSQRRFFNVGQDETLEALLTESASRQQEVTDQLGKQVRQAVETLVRTLDRRLEGAQRELLTSLDEKVLYEAALTVMMRLVFLLSAEERGMLLLGDPIYDQHYAISRLHAQLREQEANQGDDVLERRYDAWSRLLALFRLVYGGVEHVDLRLPAYGGRLFDPDRFPFLEGRADNTSWRDTDANPLKIDNRTVLHLLNALQYLHVPVGTGKPELRRLSFRGLDVEQIGHVYEGLLDHTAKRASTTILMLVGAKEKEPEITLEELEGAVRKGEDHLLTLLREVTEREKPTLLKVLSATNLNATDRSRLLAACHNQQALFNRVFPYVGLLRRDSFQQYMVVPPGSFYVTHGTDRRATGTHYTPRSLTEPIVQHALDPLVYEGPAEGWPQEQWRLRTPAEILDLKICDMAMGSGAFLVQTCRYLSEKLVQAWDEAEARLNGALVANGKRRKPQITPDGMLSVAQNSEELLPLDIEERLAVARRLVAERSLYGVDKNPMAVEMAKLSLWLITMAKNKPFTFLDHNLRCGDSLIGATERQLEAGAMDAKSGQTEQRSWVYEAMERLLPPVIQKRKEIATLPDFDINAIEQKTRLLQETEHAIKVLKLGGDLLVGAAFLDLQKRKIEYAFDIEYMLMTQSIDQDLLQPEKAEAAIARNAKYQEQRELADKWLDGKATFHWPLEFPEVFFGKGDHGGFDALIGNPPFQGGQKITGALGTDYRDYIVRYIAAGKRGSADLCAYFFLRGSTLVRESGMGALLATNTIAQGDTRKVGLDRLVEQGWTIPRAISSRKWPGTAALEVSHVWLRRGDWASSYILDEQVVSGITSFLTIPGKAQGKPFVLVQNGSKSFIGSYVLGMGFVLESEEAQNLIAKDSRNRDVLFPYLNGEDLNSRPDQSPSRWVINFQDWPLERAEEYVDCIKIVRETVKPERDKNNRQVYREKWWHYAEKRPALYSTISGMERVLVRARIANMHSVTYVPHGWVYNEKVVVFAHCPLSLLQSNIHESWARSYSSTLKSDMQYTPSDCFETFPFPPTDQMSTLDNIGERYYQHRQSIMLARQEGLTKTYNRFHNPREHAQDIVTLRELHREMDQLVAYAYGWHNLDLGHDFHETKQGIRYTISEAARREVLDRLLLLNHQRHAEEEAAGLTTRKGKTSAGKGTSKNKTTRTGHTSSLSDHLDRGRTKGEESPEFQQTTLF